MTDQLEQFINCLDSARDGMTQLASAGGGIQEITFPNPLASQVLSHLNEAKALILGREPASPEPKLLPDESVP